MSCPGLGRPYPPRVDDIERYWQEPPPEPSPRSQFWIRRIVLAGWRRNRRIRAMGYSESAEYFGVYIWEWLNELSPLFTAIESFGAEAGLAPAEL